MKYLLLATLAVLLFVQAMAAVPYPPPLDRNLSEDYNDNNLENFLGRADKGIININTCNPCMFPGEHASDEEVAATANPTIAAPTLPAAATCGAPTADARGRGSSSSGGNRPLPPYSRTDCLCTVVIVSPSFISKDLLEVASNQKNSVKFAYCLMSVGARFHLDGPGGMVVLFLGNNNNPLPP
ncbi:uncharacterized protein CEXT_205671 [Caerostris extrusa]|uniref:Uncharacterized protein n=1 Tax=Caerostris extrusa TaxID=172846 RepID=A0AAV4W2B6_CAEEX|nr:uncharacterized protein CEXT_205671 [Caerostris extrusa]